MLHAARVRLDETRLARDVRRVYLARVRCARRAASSNAASAPGGSGSCWVAKPARSAAASTSATVAPSAVVNDGEVVAEVADEAGEVVQHVLEREVRRGAGTVGMDRRSPAYVLVVLVELSSEPPREELEVAFRVRGLLDDYPLSYSSTIVPRDVRVLDRYPHTI